MCGCRLWAAAGVDKLSEKSSPSDPSTTEDPFGIWHGSHAYLGVRDFLLPAGICWLLWRPRCCLRSIPWNVMTMPSCEGLGFWHFGRFFCFAVLGDPAGWCSRHRMSFTQSVDKSGSVRSVGVQVAYRKVDPKETMRSRLSRQATFLM